MGPTTGGNFVTIYGHHLLDAKTVKFGDVRATNLVVVNDDKLTVTSPAHSAGMVRVRVIAWGGRSSARGPWYQYIEPPTITNVSPPTGGMSGDTPVTVIGTGFSNTRAVRFGGIDGTNLQVLNDTTLTVTTPAHPIGTVRVRVIRSGAGSPPSSAAQFTYDQGPPAITDRSPTSGPAAGGTVITITGIRLTGLTSVTIGGVSVPYTVNSDTMVTFTTPPHAMGVVNISVTGPTGTGTLGGAFFYLP